MKTWVGLLALFLVGCGGGGGETPVTPPPSNQTSIYGVYQGTLRVGTQTHNANFNVSQTNADIQSTLGRITLNPSTGDCTLTINNITEPCVLDLRVNDSMVYGTVYREGFASDWTRVYSAWGQLRATRGQ